MKIEICEQMVASWLQHCKQCELVQTNWSVSPLREITSAHIGQVEAFMKDMEAELSQELEEETKAALQLAVELDMLSASEEQESPKKKPAKKTKLNIFKKSTAHQFIYQCEIDVVGCKLDDGITERIYLVDTAFHRGGLGYHDAVATVVKKIIRALVVAVLVFGESVPVTVAFVSPKCGDTLRKKIESVVAGLCKILAANPHYANIEVELYFNETFTTEIYLPLLSHLADINNDNELFLRAAQLAQLAEGYRQQAAVPASTPATPVLQKAKRGGNSQVVFGILGDLLKEGKMTSTLLEDLQKPEFAKARFKMPTYPILKRKSEFPYSGHERCRYYEKTLTVAGVEYLVCSQWIPERIEKLKEWHSQL